MAWQRVERDSESPVRGRGTVTSIPGPPKNKNLQFQPAVRLKPLQQFSRNSARSQLWFLIGSCRQSIPFGQEGDGQKMGGAWAPLFKGPKRLALVQSWAEVQLSEDKKVSR